MNLEILADKKYFIPLAPANPAAERRGETRTSVRKLVEDRQEMLVLFCRLAGLKPYSANRSAADLLREFLQRLVDYMALGHFSIYRRIAEDQERRNTVLEVAMSLYPDILRTTEATINFNDKYTGREEIGDTGKLQQDLSGLGETLATRIELEDRLIQALLSP